jgi:hypothetical protein
MKRNVDAPNPLHNPCSLAWHQDLNGLAAAVDDRRVLPVAGDPKSPDSAVP